MSAKEDEALEEYAKKRGLSKAQVIRMHLKPIFERKPSRPDEFDEDLDDDTAEDEEL